MKDEIDELLAVAEMPAPEKVGILKKHTNKKKVRPKFEVDEPPKYKNDVTKSVTSSPEDGDNDDDDWPIKDDSLDDVNDSKEKNKEKREKLQRTTTFDKLAEEVFEAAYDELENSYLDLDEVVMELPPPCDPPPPDDEEALSYLFFVRECFMNCSAHGFPRAIESPTQARKYVWTLFTLCSIAVFFYQVTTTTTLPLPHPHLRRTLPASHT